MCWHLALLDYASECAWRFGSPTAVLPSWDMRLGVGMGENRPHMRCRRTELLARVVRTRVSRHLVGVIRLYGRAGLPGLVRTQLNGAIYDVLNQNDKDVVSRET